MDKAVSLTGIYNQIMASELPKSGIACRIISRKQAQGQAISASTVRQALQAGDWEKLSALVPETTLSYFRSPQAQGVLERIRRTENVVHY